MKRVSKILKVAIAVVLAGLLISQTGCGSSKYGMVPCPCHKKSNHR